jgi:hypothetical protein
MLAFNQLSTYYFDSYLAMTYEIVELAKKKEVRAAIKGERRAITHAYSLNKEEACT